LRHASQEEGLFGGKLRLAFSKKRKTKPFFFFFPYLTCPGFLNISRFALPPRACTAVFEATPEGCNRRLNFFFLFSFFFFHRKQLARAAMTMTRSTGIGPVRGESAGVGVG
jgi:hypothetical protein